MQVLRFGRVEGGFEARLRAASSCGPRPTHYLLVKSFTEMAILRLGSGGGLWRLPGRAALDLSREQKKQTASGESAIQAMGRPIQGMV